jgi:hypothetical protein
MIKYLLLLILLVLLILILNLNLKEQFSNQICGNFGCVNDNCAITEETKICKDGRKSINNIPNCYYDKVVDPNNLKCVDFCVKTYTWEDGKTGATGNDISKQFINAKKHSYFSSKCNECIDNFYDRIQLFKN